jgi:hypothetical protein
MTWHGLDVSERKPRTDRFSDRLQFVFLSAFGGCDADHENSLCRKGAGRPVDNGVDILHLHNTITEAGGGETPQRPKGPR